MWPPQPAACRRFPGRKVLDLGEQVYRCERLQAVVRVAVGQGAEVTGLQVVDAIGEVSRQISAALKVYGLVADLDDHELTIEVQARVTAWPAVPGVTTPEQNPMLDDAS